MANPDVNEPCSPPRWKLGAPTLLVSYLATVTPRACCTRLANALVEMRAVRH
jgi:hypothetical protein